MNNSTEDFQYCTENCRNIPFGIVLVMQGLLYIPPYVVCLVILVREKYRVNAGYKIMIAMGVVDITSVFFGSIVCGTASLLGMPIPKYYWQARILGALSWSLWGLYYCLNIILGLDRLVELAWPSYAKSLFHGWKVLPWIGAAYAVGILETCIFMTPYATILYYSEGGVSYYPLVEEGVNIAPYIVRAMDAFGQISIPIIYTAVVIAFRRRVAGVNSPELDEKERMMEKEFSEEWLDLCGGLAGWDELCARAIDCHDARPFAKCIPESLEKILLECEGWVRGTDYPAEAVSDMSPSGLLLQTERSAAWLILLNDASSMDLGFHKPGSPVWDCLESRKSGGQRNYTVTMDDNDQACLSVERVEQERAVVWQAVALATLVTINIIPNINDTFFHIEDFYLFFFTNLLWQSAHGLNSVVYLTLNPRLRRDVIHMFKGPNAVQSFSTS